ncbi:delta-type opioid receptor-like [Solea senegalensis]|uniref:Delta-type opioid receptor-like n=1 Tax=Solea senegalensis TaxID=28829 RepID=A0AAV6SRY0_SOLSE|nr:nociceptin receptor [Solea senegalensis]KAG7519929.1 delta-type opioid receptor-like [Solea senegalensis]
MEFPDDFLLAELDHLQLYNDSLFQDNFTGAYNETDALLPTGVKVTIVVVYMIVCVIGLVGNFLVMYVIIRYTKMKTATNIYIFNLALADSLFLATLPFQGTDVFLGFWPFGNALCKAVVSIDYYNMFTSTFTLTVMSMDRYVAVCHPVKALDMRTPHKAKVVNICVWVLASAFGVPAMVMGNVEEEQEHNSVECIVVLPEPRSHWDPVFGTCVFLFSFLIPVAIISICYSLMVKRLRSVRILSGSKEKDRNLRRITRMVLVVVAAFVVCWTPIQIMVLAQSLGFNLSSLFTLVLMHFCIALGYVNSSLNPVLYAFLDENFKRCFREFCHPSPFHLDTQQSGRMRSIAREVAAAYSYKTGDGGGPGGGKPNPA